MRMQEFVKRDGNDRLNKWGHVIQRCSLGFLILCNSCSIVSNCIATALFTKCAEYSGDASDAFASGDFLLGFDFFQKAAQEVSSATLAASVQQVHSPATESLTHSIFADSPIAVKFVRSFILLVLSLTRVQWIEVVMLLFIIGAFSVASLLSMKRIHNTLAVFNRVTDSRRLLVPHPQKGASKPKLVNAAGRHLRLQILGTFATVFVTFLIRAAWSILNALSYEEDSFSNLIGGCKPCDGSCSSVSVPLFYFLQFTPQLQMSIMLVSSPLTLLVALWGMTSAVTWKCLRGQCDHNF